MKKYLLFLPMLFLLSSCDDRYKEGFNVGYKQGFNDGYYKGESEGYAKGNKFFIGETIIPSLGFTVVIVISGTFFVALYIFFVNPTKRRFKLVSDKREEKIRRKLTKEDLNRKIISDNEMSRLKAKIDTAKSFEFINEVLAGSVANKELEKLRLECEERIFKIYIDKIDTINDVYQEILKEVEKNKNLSSEEKMSLYNEIREAIFA